MKWLKNCLLIILIISLFLTNYLPHHNILPQHVDSWQVVTKADFVLKNKEVSFLEPFSNTASTYPPGAHLSLAVIKSITGIDMLKLSNILSGIFLVILGLFMYSVSKILFKKELIAISIFAFTSLSLSNITILGPFYLVPVTWGMFLSLLLFYLLIKKEWIISILILISIAVTHTSSTVFALLGAALLFVFNKEYWPKIKYLIIAGIIIGSIITFNIGLESVWSILLNIFTFQKAQPYINFYKSIPIIFFILLIIGFYLIASREKKASKFLIPLFMILAINSFLYLNWKGFFLVYRRLFTFTFMMVPFFVGYATYAVSSFIEGFAKKKLSFIRKHNLILILLLLILIPLAVKTNIAYHKDNYVYVDQAENQLFTDFGKEYKNAYLTTNHLQAFSLPYYNLKPVQLSPAHGTDTLYYDELTPCFDNQDINCFGRFFYSNDFAEYLYVGAKVNSTYFKPFFQSNNRIIYRFSRENYEKQLNSTQG